MNDRSKDAPPSEEEREELKRKIEERKAKLKQWNWDYHREYDIAPWAFDGE